MAKAVVNFDNCFYIHKYLKNIKNMIYKNCSRDKGIKVVAELEKGVGLIERKKRGQGKPTLIYMKKFICDNVKKVLTQQQTNPS